MTTAAAPAEKPSFFDAFRALRNPNYRRYWISGLGMTGAQGIQQLALAWLVLDLTDSAGQLGLVVMVQGISTTAMALYGGVLVDRYNRKTLLQISQTFTFLNLVTLAALILSGMVEVW
jgi:MFS family permease